VAVACFTFLPAHFRSFTGVTDLGVRLYNGNPRWIAFGAILIGIVLASAIQLLTGYFTETNRRPVRDIGEASETGAATVILSGVSIGMESAVYSALLIAAAVFCSYLLATGNATIALFALAAVGLRFVQQQFFPASDRPELVVDLSLPQNATITATEAAAETLEKLLAGDPKIDRYSVYVGQGAVHFYLPLNVQLAHDYFAQAVVATTGLAAREAVRSRLEETLTTALPDIATRIYPLELGPPVGWPLQYRVSGADPQKIRDLAYAVADIVASNSWTRKIGFDWNEPIKAVHVNVDQDKARRLGISSEALAQAINATTRGLVITQLRDYVYLVDVIARAGGNERASLDTLRTLQLPLPGGRNLPLLDVASLEYTLVCRF